MGSTFEQGDDGSYDEKPVHRVTVDSYYIGETEVTKALWDAVMNEQSGSGKEVNLPVENVSWIDCQEFISKLNKIVGSDFSLPTEAQWEFAARGGNKAVGNKYSGSNSINDVAWYEGNSVAVAHEVKTRESNELGLYDMSGNVWEWCADWKAVYGNEEQTNPLGPATGSFRVLRGGCCINQEEGCRVSNRNADAPYNKGKHYGFRLVLSLLKVN